jgi:uncharacterized protein YdaU (DUF1376 family)
VTPDENKPPSYPWYPRDFAMDEPVQMMTLEEEGAYRRLLDHQWLHGSIPADVAQLARICKNVPPAKMRKLWGAIAPLFVADADGLRYRNRKLERVRQEREEYRQRQSEAGRRGARQRWHPTPEANGDPNGGGIATPVADQWPASASAFASANDPPSPPARRAVDRCRSLMPPEYHETLENALRSSANADTLAGELCALADGIRGAPAPSWADLGLALHDMSATRGEKTLQMLRGFARKARDSGGQLRPPPRVAVTPGDVKAQVEELDRKKAERLRRHTA